MYRCVWFSACVSVSLCVFVCVSVRASVGEAGGPVKLIPFRESGLTSLEQEIGPRGSGRFYPLVKAMHTWTHFTNQTYPHGQNSLLHPQTHTHTHTHWRSNPLSHHQTHALPDNNPLLVPGLADHSKYISWLVKRDMVLPNVCNTVCVCVCVCVYLSVCACLCVCEWTLQMRGGRMTCQKIIF